MYAQHEALALPFECSDVWYVVQHATCYQRSELLIFLPMGKLYSMKMDFSRCRDLVQEWKWCVLNIWCWRGRVSHAESLSVYLTGMMIQRAPLLQPRSHLIVSMQDSDLQGTCVAFGSALPVTFWSRLRPTMGWTAAGVIWLIQARGEWDVNPGGFRQG